MRQILLMMGYVFFLLLASNSLAQSGKGTLEIKVLSKASGQPVPCRVHLTDAAGKVQRADKLPFWYDHFVCPGTASLTLIPGTYTYEIERGPEYGRLSGKFAIKENDTTRLQLELERILDMPAEGWWPGELLVHRPVEDIELLMQAEDLHVAPV